MIWRGFFWGGGEIRALTLAHRYSTAYLVGDEHKGAMRFDLDDRLGMALFERRHCLALDVHDCGHEQDDDDEEAEDDHRGYELAIGGDARRTVAGVRGAKPALPTHPVGGCESQ